MTEPEKKVNELADEIINSATECIDRGVDPESGKRGICHVFRGSDVCICGAVDLKREQMK